jgi:hypothetical protein
VYNIFAAGPIHQAAHGVRKLTISAAPAIRRGAQHRTSLFNPTPSTQAWYAARKFISYLRAGGHLNSSYDFFAPSRSFFTHYTDIMSYEITTFSDREVRLHDQGGNFYDSRKFDHLALFKYSWQSFFLNLIADRCHLASL